MPTQKQQVSLSQRPKTPEEGVMPRPHNVQHRSDLLMEEQTKNVHKAQESLKTALLQLETARGPDEVEKITREIRNLRERSESLLVSLQLMHKINIELAHARADLEDALYHSVGDINLARKRVIWLEDRMGALCGKRRLRQVGMRDEEDVLGPDIGVGESTMYLRRRVSKMSSNDNLVGIDEDESEGNMATYRLNMAEELGFISDKSDISMITGGQSSGLDGTMDGTHYPADSTVSDPSRRGGAAEDLEAGQHLMIQMPSVEEQRMVEEVKLPTTSGDSTPAPVTARTDQALSPSSEEDKRATSPELSSEEEGATPVRGEEGSQETAEGMNEAMLEDRQEERETDGQEEDEDEEKETLAEPLFITERPKSKVTIVAPRTADAEPEDLGRAYWDSEHHRFEYNEFADVLCELDPLSYHQMGLAVPGSFLHGEHPDFQELPWRTHRRGSDIKDIHRIALDKLAAKLHGMQDRVYHATMLSIQPSLQERVTVREPSLIQSMDLTTRASTSPPQKRIMRPPSTAESGRSKTESCISLPKMEGRRLGTSCSGRLIYYPKPIPPPQVLPITRTSKDKEFPRFASAFADVENQWRKPAERIVDQRNLMEETKLVLFREKTRQPSPGPSRMENRFRQMIERERTASTKGSKKSSAASSNPPVDRREMLRRKLKQTFAIAKTMAQLHSGVSGWSQIKPQSKGKEYSGLRWERVKSIVHSNLVNERPEERIDAAKQLGLLRSGDPMVFFALKERLNQDPEPRVRYEAAKALVLIGCWEEEVMQVMLKYLVIGNSEIRMDLINTMINGKNVQYANKSVPSFKEMVKLLSHFCSNPDPDDPIAMEAAVLLGKLCIADSCAKGKLLAALGNNSSTHIRAKALEVLVKQMNCTDLNVVSSIQELFRTSPVWRYRSLAAKLLISLGPGHPCVVKDNENIYKLLECKLWDDPSMEVRVDAAKTLTALGMFSRACEAVERRLEDKDEEARAQAVISVGTLGMKNEKLIRLLLEMLELDSSEYVRLMIIRTFATLNLADKRVVRALRDREKLEGPLARESKRALKNLESSQPNVEMLPKPRARDLPNAPFALRSSTEISI